jgi:aspartyl protease family protein
MQSGVRYLVREAFTWTLVICLGFFGAFYYDDIVAHLNPTKAALQQAYAKRGTQTDNAGASFESSVRVIADGNGHFAIDAFINDRPITLMADTGATFVTLTYEDARNAGIPPADLDFTGRTHTANGVAKVAPVTLRRIRAGSIIIPEVQAVVAEQGRLSVSLLGMSFLGALTRFEMRGRELVLVQ